MVAVLEITPPSTPPSAARSSFAIVASEPAAVLSIGGSLNAVKHLQAVARTVPAVVIGRHGELLSGVALTSKQHRDAIEVGTGSYYPFIRLALARYQPTSITGAHLSNVVLADIMPLAELQTKTGELRETLHRAIARMPGHAEFIEKRIPTHARVIPWQFADLKKTKLHYDVSPVPAFERVLSPVRFR